MKSATYAEDEFEVEKKATGDLFDDEFNFYCISSSNLLIKSIKNNKKKKQKMSEACDPLDAHRTRNKRNDTCCQTNRQNG